MYFEEFFEYLTECEQVCNEEAIKMESIHPYEIISDRDCIIQEAVLSRDNINKTLLTLIATFEKIIKKARLIAAELTKKNKSWFDSVNNYFKNNHETNIEEYEIYDYITGIERMQNTNIPKFESIEISHFEDDGNEFKAKAFKDIYLTAQTDENGNKTTSVDFRAKAYFRGGTEKKKLNKSEIMSFAKYGYDFLKNYNSIISKISSDSEEVNNVMKKILNSSSKAPITESTLLHDSLFKDEYYDILDEAAVDPTDIEKEQNDNNTPINTNSEENKSSDESKTRLNAAKIWYKTCSSILTAKIDIMQESYKAFTDLIDKMMSNTDKKEAVPDNSITNNGGM